MSKETSFVRQLLKCRRKDYAEAAKEVITTLAFALMPLWLGALILALTIRGSAAKYATEFLVSGEALLVSAALIGPVIYIITKKHGDLPKTLTVHFPQGWFFLFIAFAICVITAAIVGLQRGYAQLPAVVNQGPLFETDLVRDFSAAVLLVTVPCLYLVTVFKNYVDTGASSEMHSQERDFLKQWRRK